MGAKQPHYWFQKVFLHFTFTKYVVHPSYRKETTIFKALTIPHSVRHRPSDDLNYS